MEDQEDRTERDDGSEPVREHPPEALGPGWGAMQMVAMVIGGVVVLAALLWLLLPFLAG